MKANAYYLARCWREDEKLKIEVHRKELFEPTLSLDLREGYRPIGDWWYESFETDLEYDTGAFIPDALEVCEEPIWVEVIGHYSATAWRDYWGEYDEDFDFEILDWSVAIDDDSEDDIIQIK